MKSSIPPHTPAYYSSSTPASHAGPSNIGTAPASVPVCGLANVALYTATHGIPSHHLQKMQRVAQSRNTPYAVRFTTRGAAEDMDLGHHTKPLNVKAKTCQSGIARARIRSDGLSRPDNRELTESSQRNIHSLLSDPNSGVISTQLMLTAQQLEKLRSDGEIQITDHKGETLARSRSGEYLLTPQGPLNAQGKAQLYAVSERKKGAHSRVSTTPLHVLTAKPQQGPVRSVHQLVADYDMLMTGTPFENFGERSIPKAHSGRGTFENALRNQYVHARPAAADTAYIESGFAAFSFGNATPASFSQAVPPPPSGFNPERRGSVFNSRGGMSWTPSAPRKSSAGVASESDHELINAINLELGVTAVQHGPEINNPATSILAASEAVFFLPKTIANGSGVIMARTHEEVKSVLASIKDAHFTFIGNDTWGRRPSAQFTANRNRFENG
ncbi:anthrax toxin-like adenylyl cyclase domain-containing protein [Janthinobacterium agaricidamnosum]|nr:anthrax toxin-like adenylyl cyclase domain-containing protein [Janthinobacterium agaricidamnosum]